MKEMSGEASKERGSSQARTAFMSLKNSFFHKEDQLRFVHSKRLTKNFTSSIIYSSAKNYEGLAKNVEGLGQKRSPERLRLRQSQKPALWPSPDPRARTVRSSMEKLRADFKSLALRAKFPAQKNQEASASKPSMKMSSSMVSLGAELTQSETLRLKLVTCSKKSFKKIEVDKKIRATQSSTSPLRLNSGFSEPDPHPTTIRRRSPINPPILPAIPDDPRENLRSSAEEPHSSKPASTLLANKKLSHYSFPLKDPPRVFKPPSQSSDFLDLVFGKRKASKTLFNQEKIIAPAVDRDPNFNLAPLEIKDTIDQSPIVQTPQNSKSALRPRMKPVKPKMTLKSELIDRYREEEAGVQQRNSHQPTESLWEKLGLFGQPKKANPKIFDQKEEEKLKKEKPTGAKMKEDELIRVKPREKRFKEEETKEERPLEESPLEEAPQKNLQRGNFSILCEEVEMAARMGKETLKGGRTSEARLVDNSKGSSKRVEKEGVFRENEFNNVFKILGFFERDSGLQKTRQKIRDQLKEIKKLEISAEASCGLRDDEEIFLSDYIVGSVIGEGAHSVVKSAVHRNTGETFAVKIYRKAWLADPLRTKSFETEREILARLDHPYTIRLIESLSATKHEFLILEHATPRPLNTFIAEEPNGRIEEPQASGLFRQLLEALAYIHSIDIIHRDIKLQNVLLNSDGTLKLVDFGFAALCKAPGRPRPPCGTPSYMSPELLRNARRVGKPADIWALGCLLFRLVSGSFPFEATSEADLFSKILTAKLSVPRFLSEDLRSLLQGLLDKDPNIRPSAQEALAHPWITRHSN